MATLIKERRVVSESPPSPERQGDPPRAERRPGCGGGRARGRDARRGELPEVRRRPRLLDRAPAARRATATGASCARSARSPATLFYMERCGFDAFELREGEDPAEALAALRRLQRGLPGPWREPVPLFRRRTAGRSSVSAHRRRRLSPAALASSLSAEDMVLTDAIARAGLPIEVFVLDTGRLHAETLALLDETAKRTTASRCASMRPMPQAVSPVRAPARPRRLLRRASSCASAAARSARSSR